MHGILCWYSICNKYTGTVLTLAHSLVWIWYEIGVCAKDAGMWPFVCQRKKEKKNTHTKQNNEDITEYKDHCLQQGGVFFYFFFNLITYTSDDWPTDEPCQSLHQFFIINFFFLRSQNHDEHSLWLWNIVN